MAKKTTWRIGSKVKFNIGRGTFTGKIHSFNSVGMACITPDSEDTINVFYWRKLEKITRA